MRLVDKYNKEHIPAGICGRTRRIIFAGLMAVAACGAKSGTPKLAVGIFIDGAEYDRLVKLKDSFGKDGFARFLDQGVVIPTVDYGPSLDAAASTAVAVTGSSPALNGITSGLAYNPLLKRLSPSLDDPHAMGNFTSQTYSPRNLLSSTLSDETKISGSGVGYVYSVACDPQTAILLAGHSADGALWLDDDTGAWAGSTFYAEMPTSVVTRNRMSPLASRLDTMSWTPSAAAKAYADIPQHLTHYPFRYVFPRSDRDRYSKFAASPLSAGEVVSVASDLIKSLSLGTHSGPDMINVGLTVSPFDYTKNTDNRFEHIDTYIRVDKAIGELINNAERQAGKGNCLFYLVATPPSSSHRPDEERWRIPTGQFSLKKAMSLLNMYLMAMFGNGDYVSASDGKRFYLNKETIKTKKLALGDIRRESAMFLRRMSGVRDAYTLDDILDGTAGHNPEALKRNTPADAAYDIVVSLRPGWALVDDFNNIIPKAGKKDKNIAAANPTAGFQKVERLSATYAPAMILAPGLTPRMLPDPIDARALAPTLARIMGIRAPNGAELPPTTLH